MSWIGRKKLAFVPVYRPHAIPPDQIPANWETDILRRALHDPDPVTGLDRSLRAYIHTVSSGRADLDAVVLPMQIVDQQDVPPTILESQLGAQLREQGFDAAGVTLQLAPAWTTDWIGDGAREKLRQFGIAPPQGCAQAAPAGEQPLRFVARTNAASVPCPHCGSTNTTELAHFGSTACKAQWRCLDCLEPFDHFKPY